MSDELHVIFGSGQVGAQLARRLIGAGKRVRVVKRTAGGVPEGAQVMLGDAIDGSFCQRAAAAAATVYNCMNPPYEAAAWERLWPAYVDNLIAAAGHAGARLIVLNNLYMLGNPHGAVINEDTPMRPCSKKGDVRARASERLFAAHERGQVRAAEARASDFYGPGGHQTYVGDYFWKPALAGRRVLLPIDADAQHTYHYIPDVAAGLAVLGNADDADLGHPWMLPCQPAETLNALVSRLASALGRPIRLGRIPRFVMKASAVFMPFMRELAEMAYQWEAPFIVDDRRFRDRFALLPAGRDEAARATVIWATSAYA